MRFSHRFEGNLLVIDKADQPTLTVPLELRRDGKPLAMRRWKVRQGGAQARSERGGGFVAVDFRKDGPYFHWRGVLGDLVADALTVLHRVDVMGWTIDWPGLDSPVRIDSTTSLTHGFGACEGAGGAAPRARWIYLSPTTTDDSTDRSGWMLSFAGPGSAGGVSIQVDNGYLSAAFVAFDNRFRSGHFDGPYVVLDLDSTEDAAAMHARLTGKEGYLRTADNPRAWWSWPTLYATNKFLASLGEGDPVAHRGDLLARLDAMAAEGGTEGALLALDTRWCDAPGDWNPMCPGLFGDFTGWGTFAGALHDRGHKVLPAFAPFLIDAGSALPEEAAWLLLRHSQGGFVQTAAGDYFLDFTSSETRERTRDTVRFILGDGEQEMGADGLILEPLGAPANGTDAAWNDPTWCGGEVLWSRALQFVLGAARQVRPECLVEVVGADPMVSVAGNRLRPQELFGGRYRYAGGVGDEEGGAEAGRPAPLRRDLLVPGMIAVSLGDASDDGAGADARRRRVAAPVVPGVVL